ncbi:formate dehydrogenase accessory protein FdhE [Shigella flexneri]
MGCPVALLGADGNLIPGKARAEYGEQRQYCPVCGSMPVSSMVQIGTTRVCVICTATCAKPSGTWCA